MSTKPRVPKSIVLTDRDVIIDGESFPFYIPEEGVEVWESNDSPDTKLLMVPIIFFDDTTELEDRRSA